MDSNKRVPTLCSVKYITGSSKKPLPELQVVLHRFALQLLNVLGQRDVLRTDLGTRELGLTPPDAVFLF